MQRFTRGAKAISDALLAVWDNAEDAEDYEIADDVKAALDRLGLPYVRIADSDVEDAKATASAES